MLNGLTGRIAATALALVSLCVTAAGQVTSPVEFLGFTPGDNYKLANYTQSHAYFKKIAGQTGRMRLFEAGKSSMGAPMILAVISSEENLARLDRLKEIARLLAGGRLGDEEARALAKEGRAMVWIDMGLHSTEVGPAQHAINLAHDLVTSEDEEYRRIRDNVVLLLMPSINPDGHNMVADWFTSHYGTPREGTPMPWLYQKYAGHDNNRDWFMLNLLESRNVTRLLYHEYFPQIVYNHHQTAPFPARIWVPPNAEPLNPNIPPLIIRAINLVGAAMQARFEAERKSGVISFTTFSSWWNGGMRTTPYYHNVVGILTETAHASPYPANYELRAEQMEPTAWYPNPYRGGRWNFSDTIDYLNTASMGVLTIAASLPEMFQYNMHLLASWSVEKGRTETPFGFIFPMDQRDPNTAVDFLDRMRLGGLDIHVAASAFDYDGKNYPAGTPVILASQPYRPHLIDMVKPQNHPMRRQYPDGPPIRPYDVAGWTLTEQMGVTTVEMRQKPSEELLAALVRSDTVPRPEAAIIGPRPGPRGAYLLPAGRNVSVRAANRLLAEGRRVEWLREDATIGGKRYEPGTLVVPAVTGVHESINRIARELHVPAVGVDSVGSAPTLKLKKLRVATYDPYGGNMPQGWTQYIMEQFDFDHSTVTNPDIRSGRLRDRIDVLILTTYPNVEDRSAAARRVQGGLGGGFLGGPSPRELDPEASARLEGMGKEGVDNIVEFVRQGGVLISMRPANDSTISLFRLPVREVTRGTSFYSPGSVWRAYVDPTHPFGWGMPAESTIYFDNGHAWEADISFPSVSQGGAFVRYPEKNPLVSGWIISDEVVHNRAAAVEFRVGTGRVVLFGFDVVFRAQPHLGFRLLFNAMHAGAAEAVEAGRP